MARRALSEAGAAAGEVPPGARPLADRMRPRRLPEFRGQPHLVGEGKPLRRLIESGHIHSMVFWGPPGSGKTTLARLIADYCDARFVALSAVMAGVKDIRTTVAAAREARATADEATILFLDEVHRFNKAQQDAFLPFVEDGTLIFIGATTENPSFELNNALLSRARVYVLRALEEGALGEILEAALADEERGLGGRGLRLEPEALAALGRVADGDARRALNMLEVCADLAADDGLIGAEIVAEVAAEGTRRFDKGGEAFYDQISALHKSVRGSQPDAALYWLARMLDGGCDPLYIARRLVRIASEDIGNADPRALTLALAAWDVQVRLGSPEGELALAQAAVFLACAAKSDATYKALKSAMADVAEHGSLEVPLHLRNAPTRLMKELGYGKQYRHAHQEADAYAAGERYFPEEMPERKYYHPVRRGLETRIGEKLAELERRDREARSRKKKP